MQQTTSGAAGNGLCTTMMYLRGAANNGLGTTIKYERGWPSYFIVVRREKIVGVRGAQICVRKLAANASDFATSECLVFSIVTRDNGFEVG